MPWTLEQVKQAVTQLTSPDEHATYRLEGDTIVGQWSAGAEWAGPTGGGAQSDSYRFVVELADDHTFRMRESGGSAQTGGGLDSSGGASLKSEKSFFSGHSKQWSFEAGAAPQVSSSGQGEGSTYSYTLDTQQLKQPVLDLLEQAGWTNGGGFLSRLFGG